MNDMSQAVAPPQVGYDISVGGLADEAARLIDVVLEGGPGHLPLEWRSRQLAASDQKVKIEHHGGYEHFERDGVAMPDDPQPVVFRWTGRTRVAE
ncbi:DUF5988 family protein [Micromonospora matsumotoense]|uniref:DUF5988 family protein n=1 Tax=Micromonospora matsumotoense TaxID=121616 RepID=UPI0033CAE7DF